MKVVIVGCGRTGATMAELLDAAGHSVLIMDTQATAFDRLPASFHGEAIRGDGTDEGVLRRVGAADADVFMILTQGDNRNVMGAQVARDSLNIRSVIAKVNDPVRAQVYAELGIATVCRTVMLADTLLGAIGEPATGMRWLFEAPGPASGEGSPQAGPRSAAAQEG